MAGKRKDLQAHNTAGGGRDTLRAPEARHAFLLELSDTLRALTDPEAVRQAATEALRRVLGVARVIYFDMDTQPQEANARQAVPETAQYSEHLSAMYQRGETVTVSDLCADARFDAEIRERLATLGIRAELSVPLLKRDGLVAMLSAQHDAPRPWTSGEISLVEDVAERTWAAAERARAVAALRASEARQAYLLKLADALRPLADPAAIQGEAARVLGEHLQSGRAYYVEVDERAGEYVIARDWHQPGETSHAGRYPLAAWRLPWLSDGSTWVVRDTATDPAMPDDQREAYQSKHIGAMIVVPLIKDGRLVATCLVNQGTPRDWSAHDVGLVEQTAERTWAAVERARAEQAVHEREAELARVQRIGGVAGVDIDLVDGMMTRRRSPEFRLLHGLAASVVVETHDDWLRRLHPDDREHADHAMRDAIAAGAPHYADEYRIIRPDTGETRWIAARADIEYGADGTPRRLVGAHIDITERKRMEEALRRSEDRLQRVLESISDGLVVVGRDGRISHVNAAARQMLASQDVDADALIGSDYRTALSVLTGDGAEVFRHVMEDREAAEFDFRHDEWRLWYQVRAFPVREGGMSVYYHDITAAKAAEAALREREAELKRTLDSISDSFTLLDTDWRFVMVNAALRALWEAHGLDAGELVGTDIRQAFPAVSGTVFEKELRRAMVLRIPTRFDYLYEPWGVWFACRCYPVPGAGVSLYLLDITERKAAEIVLLERETALQRLVDSISDIFMVVGPDWSFKYANAAARSLTPERDDLIGRSVWDVYPEVLGTEIEEAMRVAMYERRPTSIDFARGGRGYATRCYPIEDDGISLYVRDVTDDRALAESVRRNEARWRTLTEAMPNLVWIGRAGDGGCVYVNEQCVAYTGAPADSFLEFGWINFIHPEDRQDAHARWNRCRSEGEVFDTEFRLRRFDGHFRWFKVRGVPMPALEGEERVWYGTCTDIQDMVEARHKAEAASRAKSDFLANMSHEIRTPLNAIVGLTSIMLNFKTDPAMHRQYLATMKESAESLAQLISDVLDFAKIDAAMVELDQSAFNLKGLLEEVVRMMSVKATEKSLLIDFHDGTTDEMVIGDRLRIKQILVNLLSNSVKFTDTGGIGLAARVRSGGDGAMGVTFTVSDTGIGIAPDKQEQVFEKFTQADSSITRRFGGTGLGLAICKKLCEAMGGAIRMDSTPGKGTTFTVDLPLHKAEPLVAAEPTPVRSDAAGRTAVLVVEDNAANALVAGAMLDMLGYPYLVARDGREAVKLWLDKGADVILMDLQMPRQDGFEATRRIRQIEKGQKRASHVCIIAMTAHALAEDRERCLAAGMDGYIAKPFSIDELRNRLERMSRHELDA